MYIYICPIEVVLPTPWLVWNMVTGTGNLNQKNGNM
jgi:hypothetical protein